MPRVSVIIPAYNAAATIAGTIDSVVGQSFHDFEIICVDDGSTDGTLAIIRQYADGVRLIEQANSGPAAARNNGARHSSGEYLAFLDADDVWTPQFLDRGVAALDADRSLSLVYCNCALADSEGVALDTSIVGKGFDHAPSLNELLTQLWPIMPSAAIVRRTAYDACGGYRDALKGASFRFEDVDFWIKMREQGPFGYIDEPLITWRFAWFPKQLKRLPDYSKALHVFEAYLQERYGVSAAPLVDARARAPRSILATIGLKALRDGDRRRARAAFARAIRVDPYRLKNYLRWMRTWLPHRLAQSLSGGKARRARSDRAYQE
ncbi:glycosyltransferase family 2 protein [Candidatus Binatus sp.]|uniref:glycosyltransferase family 2 protein n=1 Tax=Candidatus Binatus sp. TaxID=2811406 RepID=UPI003C640B28